jgi:hypothetical protein
MNNLALIAILASQSWITDCVMTQSESRQGYARDTARFQNSSEGEPQLYAAFKTVWYEDSGCTKPQNHETETLAIVKLGRELSKMGSATLFEADFYSMGRLELGAIELDGSKNQIRISKTSFGNSRSTMVSIFPYYGAKP